MTIEIKEYEDVDKSDWVDFLKRSNNGTIFQILIFLGYLHKDEYDKVEYFSDIQSKIY